MFKDSACCKVLSMQALWRVHASRALRQRESEAEKRKEAALCVTEQLRCRGFRLNKSLCVRLLGQVVKYGTVAECVTDHWLARKQMKLSPNSLRYALYHRCPSLGNRMHQDTSHPGDWRRVSGITSCYTGTGWAKQGKWTVGDAALTMK